MLLSNCLYAKDENKLAPLPIYLFELKPLVYQDGKDIKGLWFESYKKLSRISGIDFNYQFVSVSRLELFLSGNKPGCTPTLLKTKVRMDKMHINFIHEHKSKTLLTYYKRRDDQRNFLAKNLKDEKGLKIVTNAPPAVDALKEIGVKSELLFNVNSMIRMLMLRRIDAVVGSNLAIEEMEEFKTGQIVRGPLIKSLVHAIGCSAGTSKEYTDRLIAATKTWQID